MFFNQDHFKCAAKSSMKKYIINGIIDAAVTVCAAACLLILLVNGQSRWQTSAQESAATAPTTVSLSEEAESQTAETAASTVQPEDSPYQEGLEVATNLPLQEAAYSVHDDKAMFDVSSTDDTDCFEQYSPLDSLGRCGAVMACVDKDSLSDDARGDISSIHPTGWQSLQTEDGDWIYNRCHLLAHYLGGDDADYNLITGTSTFNTETMLGLEYRVFDVLEAEDTADDRSPGVDIHIIYRVTPIFIDDNLVASGVVMEAYSVEDKGASLEFCEYVPNYIDGYTIDYKTGNVYIRDYYDTEDTAEVPDYEENNP